jgi:hypothetical protein
MARPPPAHLAVREEARLDSRATAGRQVLFTVRTGGLTATATCLITRAVAWSAMAIPLTRRKIPDSY